jgi:hypothetical protein
LNTDLNPGAVFAFLNAIPVCDFDIIFTANRRQGCYNFFWLCCGVSSKSIPTELGQSSD